MSQENVEVVRRAWEAFNRRDYDVALQDIALTRNTGRGKTSGLEVGQIATRGANVFDIHGGKATRLVAYFNRDSALADLGLEE